jgi:D-cysteine desulfhydrase family pyridoxal phosphate-dependent enzyme
MTVAATALRKAISQLPRIKLAHLPTPLEEAPRLSEALGLRVLFKRDDLTGLALGGNKVRMLEFRLARALEEGADVVVAGFDSQSNHARLIAAACARLGLEAYLVLRRGRGPRSRPEPQGNLLLDLLLGAKVRLIEADPAEQERVIKETARRLREAGRQPFITGLDDRDLSAIAYVEGALELWEQLEERCLRADYLFLASQGSTQAGLLVGAKYLNEPFKVVGINPVDWVKDVPAQVARIANAAAKRLGLMITITPAEVISLNDYLGPGYGRLTPECIEAIKLVAQTEGLLLDPVYTGKAMAGLIDWARRGLIGPEETVVFLHTGGVPALFAYAAELVANAGFESNITEVSGIDDP